MVSRSLFGALSCLHLRKLNLSMKSRSSFSVFLLACASILFPLACCAKSAVSLDLRNPERSQEHLLRPYMIHLRQRVESTWRLDRKSRRTTKVYFEIDSSGKLSEIRVDRSSGDTAVDACSVNAVTDCSPFPPPPSTATGALVVVATFRNDEHEISGVTISEKGVVGLPPPVPPHDNSKADFKLRAESGPNAKTKCRTYEFASEPTPTSARDEWEEESSPYASPQHEIARTLKSPSEYNVRTLASLQNLNSPSLASTNFYTSNRQNSPGTSRTSWTNPNTAGTSTQKWQRATSPNSPVATGVPSDSLYRRDNLRSYSRSHVKASSIDSPAPKQPESQATPIPLSQRPGKVPASEPNSGRLPISNSAPTKPHPGTNARKRLPFSSTNAIDAMSRPSTEASSSLVYETINEFPSWAVMLAGGGLLAIWTLRNANKKKCSFCAEWVKKAALVCKHCNSSLLVPNEVVVADVSNEVILPDLSRTEIEDTHEKKQL